MLKTIEKEVIQLSKRDLSFDLLKIIGMFFIVLIHYIQKSSLLNQYEIGSLPHFLLVFFNMAGLVAVNCYFMISGYYLIHSKFHIKKIVKLWGTILFYVITIAIFYVCVCKRMIHMKELPSILFPVFSEHYWFLTVYIALYFLMPGLNIMIRKLTQKQLQYLLGVFIVAICIMGTIFPATRVLDMMNGMSLFNAIFLYTLAAYIRLYGKNTIKTYTHFCLFLLGVLLLSICYTIVSKADNSFTWKQFYLYKLFSYNSIFTVWNAYHLFYCFKEKSIKNKIVSILITWTAPLLYAVYIIHEHLFNRSIWGYITQGMQNSSCLQLLYHMFGWTLLVFIACLMIEWIRKQIFRFISKVSWIQKISEILEQGYRKIDQKIETIFQEE